MQDLKSLKHELQHIIQSDEPIGQENLIKAAQIILRRIEKTGTTAEEKKPARPEEERALERFASEESLWLSDELLGDYITEGAEQKIYHKENSTVVFKISDGIFYQNWLDYINNLLIHNSFFPSTAYTLEGFTRVNNVFSMVVSQPLVVSTEQTSLADVKKFLNKNGFLHKKNNDYYQPYLGLILEDLHDENVLTNSRVLFFVDTVFYLTEEFYQDP